MMITHYCIEEVRLQRKEITNLSKDLLGHRFFVAAMCEVMKVYDVLGTICPVPNWWREEYPNLFNRLVYIERFHSLEGEETNARSNTRSLIEFVLGLSFNEHSPLSIAMDEPLRTVDYQGNLSPKEEPTLDQFAIRFSLEARSPKLVSLLEVILLLYTEKPTGEYALLFEGVNDSIRSLLPVAKMTETGTVPLRGCEDAARQSVTNLLEQDILRMRNDPTKWTSRKYGPKKAPGENPPEGGNNEENEEDLEVDASGMLRRVGEDDDDVDNEIDGTAPDDAQFRLSFDHVKLGVVHANTVKKLKEKTTLVDFTRCIDQEISLASERLLRLVTMKEVSLMHKLAGNSEFPVSVTGAAVSESLTLPDAIAKREPDQEDWGYCQNGSVYLANFSRSLVQDRLKSRQGRHRNDSVVSDLKHVREKRQLTEGEAKSWVLSIPQKGVAECLLKNLPMKKEERADLKSAYEANYGAARAPTPLDQAAGEEDDNRASLSDPDEEEATFFSDDVAKPAAQQRKQRSSATVSRAASQPAASQKSTGQSRTTRNTPKRSNAAKGKRKVPPPSIHRSSKKKKQKNVLSSSSDPDDEGDGDDGDDELQLPTENVLR